MPVIEEEAEDLGFLLEPLEEEKIEKEKESENDEIGHGSYSSGSESESESDEIGHGSCSFGSEKESENDEIGHGSCSSDAEKAQMTTASFLVDALPRLHCRQKILVGIPHALLLLHGQSLGNLYSPWPCTLPKNLRL